MGKDVAKELSPDGQKAPDGDDPKLTPSKAKTVVGATVLAVYGGDHRKALKRYIASFAQASSGGIRMMDSLEVGSEPPCRSYQSLILLSDLNDIEHKLKLAKAPADIKHVTQSYQVFKNAHKDLLTMSNNAAKWLTAAMNDAMKLMEQDRVRRNGAVTNSRLQKDSNKLQQQQLSE